MEFTKEQIKQGMNEAYKNAGHNAYFSNGFEAGVRFALGQEEAQSPEQKAKDERYKRSLATAMILGVVAVFVVLVLIVILT